MFSTAVSGHEIFLSVFFSALLPDAAHLLFYGQEANYTVLYDVVLHSGLHYVLCIAGVCGI